MSKENPGRWLAVVGMTLQLAPIIGLGITAYGMVISFDAVANDPAPKTADLATGIGVSLLSTIYGLVIGWVGLLPLAVALFGYRYRAKWFYNCLLACSWVYFFRYPVGTLVGLSLYICLFYTKSQFDSPEDADAEEDPSATPG